MAGMDDSRRKLLMAAAAGFCGAAFCGAASPAPPPKARVDAVTAASQPRRPTGLSREIYSRKALYGVALPDGRVRCTLCPHNCLLSENAVGQCRTRANRHGYLITKAYGLTCIAAYPASNNHSPHVYHALKQPLMRVGLTGCSLRCGFCLVGNTVQCDPEELETPYTLPETVIRETQKYNCSAIAFTFNEPTNNYEYTITLSKMAKLKKIKSFISTNGYVNIKPIQQLSEYISGAAIGIKGFTENNYLKYTNGSLKSVLDSTIAMKKKNITVEIYYVMLPTLNDSSTEITNMGKWVRDYIGPYTAIYLMRYYPSYKMKNLPQTPLPTLMSAKKILLALGLKFVNIYLGNFLGTDDYLNNPQFDTTVLCPYCGSVLLRYVRKDGVPVPVSGVEHSRCRACHKPIPGIAGILEV